MRRSGKYPMPCCKPSFHSRLILSRPIWSGSGLWEGKLVHARRDGTRIEVHSRWVLHDEEPSDGETVFEMNQLEA